MEQITQSIERLLWFIYRIFFTLFPSVLFLFITFWVFQDKIENSYNLTIKHYKIADSNNSYILLEKDTLKLTQIISDKNINGEKIILKNNSVGEKISSVFWLIILCFCLVMNLILDAFCEKVYNFDEAVNETIENYGLFKKFENHIQTDLKEKKLTDENITSRELTFLNRMGILQSNIPLHNYHAITSSNYKIAIHTAIYSLIVATFYMPYVFDQSVSEIILAFSLLYL
jgi:hypothetical protein